MVSGHGDALNTTNLAPSWVPEPPGRGTWRIISSCVFTLSLCVFTAIHLNIGPHGQTTVAWWLHKCKWVGVAIVSPEIVLYSAGKQWFSAARLCKKLNSLVVAEAPEVPLDTLQAATVSSWSDVSARIVSPSRCPIELSAKRLISSLPLRNALSLPKIHAMGWCMDITPSWEASVSMSVTCTPP